MAAGNFQGGADTSVARPEKRTPATGVSGCRCVMFEVQKSLNDDLDVFFWQPSGGSIYPCFVFTLNLQDASTVTSP